MPGGLIMEKKLLEQLHMDNRQINRSIQQLTNIGLLGLFCAVARRAKEEHNESGMRVAKAGFVLIMITELLIIIGEVIDYCKKKH